MKMISAFVLLSAVACGAVAATSPTASPTTDAPHARATDSRTRKPSLPVTIATTLPAHITAGENLTLDVTVSSSLQQGQLIVSFVPDDGLALISPQQEQQFTLPDTGVFKTTIPLTVVPAQDGSYGVTVDFRHIIDGRERGIARGITFQVGDKPAAKVRATTAGDAADHVFSMPAKETIIRQ